MLYQGKMKLLFLLIIVMMNLVGKLESLKILSISFVSSKSNYMIHEPLLHKLAERGHEVTTVGPIIGTRKIKNIKNFRTYDPLVISRELNLPNVYEERSSGSLLSFLDNPFITMTSTVDYICRKSYKLPIIKAILKDKWDLVLFSPLYNECLYGLIHKLNTSTILISQGPIDQWTASSLGSPSPASFVPQTYSDFMDDMSYWQHLKNFVSSVYIYLAQKFYYYPTMEKIYREFLDSNLPGVKEIEVNASIALSNSHISFTRPRPLMTDIIEVGGMHIRQPMPLATDLEDFLTGAGEDGFILFSMGSALGMPERFRQIFLNTFSKLKQRVVWKWDTEKMSDLPKNVKLSKWIPQQGILSQKNIKLFITHGGIASMTEGIYHAVPLIALPLYDEQMHYMKEAERLGFAVYLDWGDLTEEVLLDAINNVLTQVKYQEAATKISGVFQDQSDDPLNRAVFWVEYIHRHNGARHLRSVSREFSTLAYYSIKVVITLLITSMFIGLINFTLNSYVLTKLTELCGPQEVPAPVPAPAARRTPEVAAPAVRRTPEVAAPATPPRPSSSKQSTPRKRTPSKKTQ